MPFHSPCKCPRTNTIPAGLHRTLKRQTRFRHTVGVLTCKECGRHAPKRPEGEQV